MRDFFVSYNRADQDWAEWIAFVIEETGMEVVIQAWDFRPGHNFPLKMQEAMASKKTILVLSPDYLKSSFGAPEWAAAFRDDPEGIERKVVPIMVRECEPPGLLASIVHIRLYELEQEDAKRTLLAGLSQGRAKPAAQPRFPGAGQGSSRPDASVRDIKDGIWKPSEPVPSRTLVPRLRVNATDRDKRLFARQGFEAICATFKRNAAEVAASEPRVQVDFEMRTSHDMRGDVYVDGKLKNSCRIRLGGTMSDTSITYGEGRHFSDSGYSEMMSVEEDGGLHFRAQLAMHSHYHTVGGEKIDYNNMDPEAAGQYLWERFVGKLV